MRGEDRVLVHHQGSAAVNAELVLALISVWHYAIFGDVTLYSRERSAPVGSDVVPRLQRCAP